MSRQPTMNSTIMLLFASVFLFTSIATCSAEKSLIDELKQMSVFELRDGSFACPLPVIGRECPSSNALFYFTCCGDTLTACCFRLQDWAIALIMIVVALTILAMIANLIRCICCG